MRRKDRTITSEEALTILQKGEYGVLSIASKDGLPYGVPLNYCYMNDAVYFHSAQEGKKLDLLNHNNSVSFCVVGDTEILPNKFTTKYESVIVSGKAVEVIQNEKQLALECIVRKFSQEYITEGIKMISTYYDKSIVYKIEIETIAGKANK